jgi:hypothetical protein
MVLMKVNSTDIYLFDRVLFSSIGNDNFWVLSDVPYSDFVIAILNINNTDAATISIELRDMIWL